MNKQTILYLILFIMVGISISAHASNDTKYSEVTKNLGFTEILLVERHAIHSTHVYTYHEEDNKPGGGLYILNLETNSSRKILDSKKGLILDANLHYNGNTILFSWKKEMTDYFQLYTIDTDGKNLKQISNHPSNNFNACWLPDGGIAFLSDRKPAYAYCWQTTTPILFRCEANGTKATRLSANYLNDFTPSVMEDGRILYSRWEYVDRPAIPIQSLWSINPDGTKLAGVFGNRTLSPGTFMDARMIPESDGKILCVLTAHNRHCHGAIGIVDPKIGGNAQVAIENITPEINIGLVDKGDGNKIQGPYVNPYPLDNNYYLVSKDGSIELRDYKNTFESQITPVSKSKEMGFYSPQPIKKRKKERLVSSRLPANSNVENEAEIEWAEIQMMNVYNGLPESIEKGSIKKLAIVQEVEKPLGINPNRRAFGFQFPVVSAGATYAPKKVWGFINVEEDGSARFKVPARQPIYFLPLDEDGMAVQRMRTFTHLMPGETQGCVGCHADRNYYGVPVRSKRPVAMAKKAQEPEMPTWGLSGFSYTREVQPILDKHCVECHGREDPAAGLELTGDKTDFFNISYENLVRKGTPSEDFIIGGTSEKFNNKYTSWIPTYNGQEANILQITPGEWGAKASLLAKKIDDGHKNKKGESRIKLTANEKLRIYMWLDLNVPYYGGSNSNYRANRGCRQQIPPDFNAAFEDMAVRRCISCHKQKDSLSVFSYPNQFALRIDHPEKNPILMAPMSKDEGGSGKCAEVVFKNKKDKDYQKLLDTFEQLRKNLSLRPRMDMFAAGEETTCIPESRTYLIGDYTNSKVSLYSDIFGHIWSYPVPGVYDCWIRPNGNVVAAGYEQVIELKPDLAAGHGGEVLWSYKQGSTAGGKPNKSEVHSCQILPSGNILVAEAGMPQLLELNTRGEVIKSLPLPKTKMTTHLQIRMARVDKNGNYWVAYIGDGKIYCINPQGKLLNEIDAKMGEADNQVLYDVIPLENGNVLASGAGTGKIREFNAQGDVIWEIAKNELPGINLSWITGVQRLPNGNTMICDWGKGKSEIKALEVTPDKKIVWQLTNPAFKGISRIQVLSSSVTQ